MPEKCTGVHLLCPNEKKSDPGRHLYGGRLLHAGTD